MFLNTLNTIGSLDDGKSKQKKFPSYAVYVAYRLEPGHGYNHNAKMSQKMSQPILTEPLDLDDMPTDGDIDQIISRQRSRESSGSATKPIGAYDIEDIDDFEYGKSVPDVQTFNGFDGGEEVEEDEKLLEDLEDKQLRERIASLESDHSNIKEQVGLYKGLEDRLVA